MDLFVFIRYGKESEFYAAIDVVDINITDEGDSNLLHAAVAAENTKAAAST